MIMTKNNTKWISLIVATVLISIILRLYVCEIFVVSGISMFPTLHDMQRILIYKLSKSINHGDIVVIDSPSGSKDFIVKRVIALPDDTVEISNGIVKVNDTILNENYLNTITEGNYSPTLIPQDMIFVMGDNRNHSLDSRSMGFIDIKAVRGKAIAVVWPPQSWCILLNGR